jgi:3-deoxy-D-manno-octulosonate 8-phosphate phosphatase (KDO 8-P phosphatase)
MVNFLNLHAAQQRALRVRRVLNDIDGVWTDGSIYYTASGEHMLRFHRRDGHGVERLRRVGIETLIVSRERSAIVEKRAQKLGIDARWGIRDKLDVFRTFAANNVHGHELAFIGDDLPDLDLLRAIGELGLTAAPADAVPEVRRVVHYVCQVEGGRGAFREFAEWILSLRGEEAVR